MDIAKLKAEDEALKRQNAQLEQEKKQWRQQREELQKSKAYLEFQLAQLQQLIFSTKSERYVPQQEPAPDQLSLDFGELCPVDQTVEHPGGEAKQVITYERKKGKHPGRHPIPNHLPTEIVPIEPTEDVSDAEHIADTIVDTLDYQPASLTRRRYIFARYVSQNRDQRTGRRTNGDHSGAYAFTAFTEKHCRGRLTGSFDDLQICLSPAFLPSAPAV